MKEEIKKDNEKIGIILAQNMEEIIKGINTKFEAQERKL